MPKHEGALPCPVAFAVSPLAQNLGVQWERCSVWPQMTCARRCHTARGCRTPSGTEVGGHRDEEAGRRVPHFRSVLPFSTVGEPCGPMQTMPLPLPRICTCQGHAHHPALRVPALWAGLLQCLQARLLHDTPNSCGGVFIDLLQIVCSTSGNCAEVGQHHAARGCAQSRWQQGHSANAERDGQQQQMLHHEAPGQEGSRRHGQAGLVVGAEGVRWQPGLLPMGKACISTDVSAVRF